LPLSQNRYVAFKELSSIYMPEVGRKYFISRESQRALFYDDSGDYFKTRWFDRYFKGRL